MGERTVSERTENIILLGEHLTVRIDVLSRVVNLDAKRDRMPALHPKHPK